MTRQAERTPAFVLKTIDYRDADRIVTLLTLRYGRLGAVARNARRSRKRFGGRLEACMLLDVGLQFGRGDLATLTDANVLQAHMGILQSLARLRSAGAGIELVRLVSPERQEDPRFFESLADFLSVLESADATRAGELALAFSARTLSLSGLTPGLDACGVSGVRCPEGQAALFDPILGTIVSRDKGGGPFRLGGTTRGKLKVALTSEWTSIPAWEARERTEAGDALAAFVRAHVGKELSGSWSDVVRGSPIGADA